MSRALTGRDGTSRGARVGTQAPCVWPSGRMRWSAGSSATRCKTRSLLCSLLTSTTCQPLLLCPRHALPPSTTTTSTPPPHRPQPLRATRPRRGASVQTLSSSSSPPVGLLSLSLSLSLSLCSAPSPVAFYLLFAVLSTCSSAPAVLNLTLRALLALPRPFLLRSPRAQRVAKSTSLRNLSATATTSTSPPLRSPPLCGFPFVPHSSAHRHLVLLSPPPWRGSPSRPPLPPAAHPFGPSTSPPRPSASRPPFVVFPSDVSLFPRRQSLSVSLVHSLFRSLYLFQPPA